MVRQFSAPTRFKLVPLASSGVILELQEGFEARGSFWSELKRWKHVAIFCEKKGTFLSCRRKTHIPGLGDSSLVEYRTTIGRSERFVLQNFPTSESFSFRSHNGLYLSNNKALGGLVFRSESKQDGATIASHRTWEITPILGFSSTDQRIKFVGVIDNSKRLVMKLQPTEEEDWGCVEPESERSLRDNDYTRHAAHSVMGDILVEGLRRGLRRGESTHFHTPNGDYHYYVRDKRGVVFMVVVSEDYSRALAGECVNDLSAIHKKFARGQTGRGFTKQGKERIESELRFLIWNYNEHNETFRHHPLRKTICDRMEKAIDRVLDSKGSNNKSRETVRELNIIAEEFHKTMRKLRARQVSKWIVAGAVWGALLGGGGGGVVGFAVGGPPGAAFVGAQAAKVGAFVVGSGASVGVACCNKPLMWKKHLPSSNYGT